MTSTIAKFSLSVQVFDSSKNISYTASPGAIVFTGESNKKFYEYEYYTNKISVFEISMQKPITSDSYLIISDLRLNNIRLHDIDLFSTYVTDQKQIIKNAYGYMNYSGTYRFKIRFGPQTHQYIINLLKKSHE